MTRPEALGLIGAALLLGAGALCPFCEAGARPAEARSLGQAADTAVARFSVSGMTCGSCATTARLALRRTPGVYSAEVSYDSATALVRYDPRRATPDRIAAHLLRLTGYRATLISSSQAAVRGIGPSR
jgi:copper chaperone CopZ